MTNTEAPAKRPRWAIRDGRDHLNLAEFPISILQRQQPADEQGRKLDSITYTSSRYDSDSHRRIPQSVTLTTNSKSGLPTPADEMVVIALLYISKYTNNFTDPRVNFVPNRLFRLMGWANNSRSYERLRQVLRRMKSLMITYENAWWDREGRRFESEYTTGIIGSYRIVRQTSGPKANAAPASWVAWELDFFESLAAGALKTLDLEKVFSLKLPTSQRMYRYLDKHFYHSPTIDLDLREFACGHVGLSEQYHIGKLKEKLQPGIEELEDIGFIDRAARSDRYRKIKPGVWRIIFRKQVDPRSLAVSEERTALPVESELTKRNVTASTAQELVSAHAEDHIRSKIDVHDWLVEKNDRRVSDNPAGWLVKAIQDDYAPPKGFKTLEEREARLNAHNRRQESIRTQRDAELAQTAAERKAVEDWLRSLPASEQAQIEQDALDQRGEFAVKMFRRTKDETFRKTAILMYAKKLMKEQVVGT